MNRTIRNALTLAATLAASLGVLPCSALAGSYVVSACSPSSSPGLWTQTNTAPASFATGNLCGGPAIGPTDGSHQGALYAEDILGSTAITIPDGSRAGWTLNAPAGTTITGISYYRSLHSFTDSNMISGLFLADGSPLEQCKIPWPFVSGSSIHCDKINDQGSVTFTGLSTSSLFFGVVCRIVVDNSSCGAGGTIHTATADLYSARVTLSESGAPTLGSIDGALWGGGIVSGVVPVTFTASDPSGIQEQQVRSDTGKTLLSVAQACDFTTSPPCPQQPAGTLNVDTSRVADGTHTFSLVVTDAAGNNADRNVAAGHRRQLRPATSDAHRGRPRRGLERHRAVVAKPCEPAGADRQGDGAALPGVVSAGDRDQRLRSRAADRPGRRPVQRAAVAA